MSIRYNDILKKGYSYLRDLHNLIENYNNSGKTSFIKRIKESISKFRIFLREQAKIFEDYKITIRYIRNYVKIVVRPICSNISRLINNILSLPDWKNHKLINALSDLSKSLHDFGCNDVAKYIFEKLYLNINDYIKLSDLLDKVLECGYLDLALKITKKMHRNGFIAFATAYNEALIRYLLGDDLGSLKLIKKIIKQFGFRFELLGLMVAIHIALGDFNNAKNVISILRNR